VEIKKRLRSLVTSQACTAVHTWEIAHLLVTLFQVVTHSRIKHCYILGLLQLFIDLVDCLRCVFFRYNLDFCPAAMFEVILCLICTNVYDFGYKILYC